MKTERPLSVVMPWPPSINGYFASVRGRLVLSKRGREYRKATAGVWRWETIEERVSIHIEAYPPDRRRRDLDNILKATLDALVHAGAISDDSLIDQLSISREEPTEDGVLHVYIYSGL
jgi:crossover junction endodeoxyribonuclease RusA